MLLRLVERADVLVENFRPAVKHRLRIDPDSLWAVNPRLVYASISGFGQDGPYADRPGVDQIAQGLGGVMSVTGPPGTGPSRVGIAISDTAAGTILTQGVLAALIARDRTGRGQWVHTSLLESMISFLDFQAARWLIDHEVPGQVGNQHPTIVPMGTYPTADGHVNVSAMGDFSGFCSMIGAPEIADDPRFADGASRVEHRNELDARIGDAFRARHTAEWVELLAETVPCGPVLQHRRGVRRSAGSPSRDDADGRRLVGRGDRGAATAAHVLRDAGDGAARPAGGGRAHARGVGRDRIRRRRDRRAPRSGRGRDEAAHGDDE